MKYFYPSGVKFLFIFSLFSLFIVNQSVANKVVPVITGVHPGKAYQGDTVQISGFDLTTTDMVFFGQVQTSYFKVLSDSVIIAVVGDADGISVGAGGNFGVYSPFLCLGVRGAPRIDSVSRYIIADDYSVLITGKYFLGTTAVAFGGIPAASFTVLDDTLIYASVGNGGSGSLSITTVAGTSYRPGFTYHPAPPQPYSFSPGRGTEDDIITIKGVRFTYARNVTFGGIPVKSFTIVSDSVITTTLNVGSSGDVVVTDSSGRLDYSLPGFSFYNFANYPPKLTGFFPKGATAGQTIIIEGMHLSHINAVTIGNKAVQGFTILTDSTISAVVAPGSTGTQVYVGSLERPDSLSGFTYIDQPVGPVVYDFSPTSAAQGTTVNIRGKNLAAVSVVDFGNTPAASYAVTSDSTISAVVGFGNSGFVIVKTGGGDSSFASGFTYGVSDVTPVITSFYPTSGRENDSVYIRGHYFTGVSYVALASEGEPFVVTSDSTISMSIRWGSSGDIEVIKPNGTSASLPGFTFIDGSVDPPIPTQPEIYDFSPKTGIVGTVITITGNHFTGTSSVIFGNGYADFTVVSDSVISATLGGGTPGVTTFVYVSGTAGNASAYGFTYEELANHPYINDFYPLSGVRGTVVTINGRNFTDVDTVTIGGTLAGAFTVVSDSVITATIGEGSSGLVGVRSPYGSAYASRYAFTYGEPANYPQITDFYPKSGVGGTVVMIYGHNLTPLENVTFGGTRASFYTAYSDSVAIGVVGDGSTGLLGVTNAYGTTYGSEFVYEMPKPEIYSFSPGTGGEGTTVYISGTTFTNISSVSFGGTPAASFIITADSLITATVGKGSTGVISVDSAFSSLIFNYINTDSAVVAKTITSYPNPSSGISWVKHPVSANSKIRMIDMMGNLVKLVAVDPSSAQTQLDISDLKSGYYKVTWSNGSDTRTGTIVIQ